MDIVTQFAASETGNKGIFSALGIDIWTLVFQIIAFLILVAVLGKFVFPVLIKTVDKRQGDIEAGAKAALAAQNKASEAEAEVAELLRVARHQAGDIVTTAKEEADAAVRGAEEKAKTRAEAIVANAQADIQKEVVAAKKALHNETLELVAMATEKVIGATVTSKLDDKVIEAAIKEAR